MFKISNQYKKEINDEFKEKYMMCLEECLYDILDAAETPENLTKIGLSLDRTEKIFDLREPLLCNGLSKWLQR